MNGAADIDAALNGRHLHAPGLLEGKVAMVTGKKMIFLFYYFLTKKGGKVILLILRQD